jgi:1,4-alpha-glucan branching enzyme
MQDGGPKLNRPNNFRPLEQQSFAQDYSARNMMTKPVNFFCESPAAKAVNLLGDFNGWNPDSHPMRRQPDGCWLLQLPLKHGHHRYLFLVDGVPALDPQATGIARREDSSKCSLLAVS